MQCPTPGIPPRSNRCSHATISDGAPAHGKAVAHRVGKTRQGFRSLPLRQGNGNDAQAPSLRELSLALWLLRQRAVGAQAGAAPVALLGKALDS